VGQEAQCTATFKRRQSKGRAHLETETLIFRGEFRLAIPFAQITSVRVDHGRLIIHFLGTVATFDLGTRADLWAQKILHPKPLIDKLGVRATDRVAMIGVRDAGFLQQLRSRTDAIISGKGAKALDVIFLQADKRTALGLLRRMRAALKPAGSIWVVAPKGMREVTETDVLTTGKKAGLVDIKVVRFSQTHTAHKFVIPKAKRR
jgi:hypothetical protein